jgi:hypothetical protein
LSKYQENSRHYRYRANLKRTADFTDIEKKRTTDFTYIEKKRTTDLTDIEQV